MKWLPLEAALADGRPLLLYVCAFYDHASHVLDAEVFDDLSLPLFACVRIDADAQPQIASRLPRPGLPRIVIVSREGKLLADHLRPSRNDLLQLADNPAGEVSAAPSPAWGAVADWPCDFRLGGFGRPPKTPMAPALTLLLEDGGSEWARPFVERTLNAIVQGGLHDHLGGGFHRASADDAWVVPQFGKRAADQAALIPLLMRAAEIFGRPQLAEAALKAALWAQEFLAAPSGGYHNAEDCDSGAWDDASFHTWSLEEAREVLDADELRAAQPWLDLYGRGELHSDPTRNVLYIATSVERIAREIGVDEKGVPALLTSAREKLAAAQRRRPRPPIDPAVHVAPSARLAQALLAFPETRAHARSTIESLKPTRDWLEDHVALGVAALAAGLPDRAAACLEQCEAFRDGDLYVDSHAPLFGPRPPISDGAGESALALLTRLLFGLGHADRAQRLRERLLPEAIALGPLGAGLARKLIAP